MAFELASLTTDFDRRNAALAPRSGALLQRVVADERLHARLMNTLSMLEHMGSYKILATQHGRTIDQATLKHLTEEARHAWFFKRQAERLAGRPLDYAAPLLLAPAAAWMYFQRIEAAILRGLGEAAGSVPVYLLTSLIVEFRAIWFYALYQQSLDRAGFPLSLRKLTGEEEVHLREMQSRLAETGHAPERARILALLERERGLYARLLAALEDASRPRASAAA